MTLISKYVIDINYLFKIIKGFWKFGLRGMWSLGDDYISPKDWRKINK